MNRKGGHLLGMAVLMVMAAACFGEEPPGAVPVAPSGGGGPEGGVGHPFVYENWEVFTTKSTDGGLPNEHIFYIKVNGKRVWIGTEDGLACYEGGKFRSWHKKDGLPWHVISGIDVSPLTGDVWLALFGGGLCRFSGGRFDHFHQLNSGLVNDVVYNVAVQDHMIWAATTAGVSSYDTRTGEWTIYTEKNAPMEEIWCYNAQYNDGKVFVAVWGGGILEWDVKLKRWKAHLDPDGQMEIDLFRDDGLIHIITTGVAYKSGILWASTYFGLSRYDGRHWRGYMQHESGLASDFINFVNARDKEAWVCTDKGLSNLTHFETDTWVTYKKNEDNENGVAIVSRGKEVVKTVPTRGAIPHNFVLCVDFQGDDVWVGTSLGLARAAGKGRWAGLKEEQPPPRTDEGKAAVEGLNTRQEAASTLEEKAGQK